MPKIRFSSLPKQPSPPPSSPNTTTALNPPHLVADDDEDNDICPVCDGECTCDNKPQLPPPGPLSMSQLSALHTASPSRSNLPSTPPVPTPKPLLPSLKIKLTVPQSMLGKRRAPHPSVPKNSMNLAETMSVAENDGYSIATPYAPQPSTSQSIPPILPKRRGRPPKAVVTARQLAARSLADAPEASTLPSTKQKKSSARLPAQLKGKPIVKKSAAGATKRKRVVTSESSDLSDVDQRYTFEADEDDDAQSGQFPTFVSASALSSRASSSSAGSDLSDLSSFDDSDSSIEAEEENFILSEIHDRARVRRELLGDDVPKKRDPHNAWVIRPRKKSESPSDVDMDVDTDGTEDEDDEEDEEGGDPDDEETDERRTGASYVGVATGWSEDDDESSFDADLFFANLSDSEERDASSSTCDDRDRDDDGDDSDMDSMMASITSLPSMPPEFEVTEGWDGQIVFTNGLREGQGMLDMDFEAHAASLAETSASPSQESDIEMSTDVDDGGYEQDADEGEGEGETTDEELVGDDDLPNERAMRLFNLPFSVSAINPMSTMSPAVSPGPRDRRPFAASRSFDSPKPADILSGKVFWDSDEHDEHEDSTTRSYSLVSSNGHGPRTGHFAPVKECRQAIIDGSHKDIPSPHPRFRRRGTSYAHYKSVENLLQKHLASQQSPASVCSPSPFHLLSPNVDGTDRMSPDTTHAQLVDLDDVLEASFLDPDPSDSQGVSTDDESRRQLTTLNRWDVISVGAFRQSREAADSGWGSDGAPGAKTDYGSMMKSSPLSTMLWQNKANNPRRQSRKMSVVISPVILPVRDRDGDRTPTNMPTHPHPPPQQNHRYDNYPHKSRKELRRERKLKRKSYGPVHHQHQHHQHHSHHHHPNLKSRSTSSSQRTNFFISSVPPLNL